MSNFNTVDAPSIDRVSDKRTVSQAPKTIRKEYTDAIKRWWDAGGQFSTRAPSLGVYLYQREAQIFKLLFGKTIPQLKTQFNVSKNQSLRSKLSSAYQTQIEAIEQQITKLVLNGKNPKEAINFLLEGE